MKGASEILEIIRWVVDHWVFVLGVMGLWRSSSCSYRTMVCRLFNQHANPPRRWRRKTGSSIGSSSLLAERRSECSFSLPSPLLFSSGFCTLEKVPQFLTLFLLHLISNYFVSIINVIVLLACVVDSVTLSCCMGNIKHWFEFDWLVIGMHAMCLAEGGWRKHVLWFSWFQL